MLAKAGGTWVAGTDNVSSRGSIANLVPSIGLWTAITVAASCTTIPTPVTAPGARPPLGGALTWAEGWGAARARIRRPDGATATISGNGDSEYGASDSTIVSGLPPAALSAHETTGEWDSLQYAGWLRFGLAARRRLFVTSGGAMTSVVATGNAQWRLNALDGSLALEQTVPLGARVSGIFRLGGGYGLRAYNIKLPHDLESTLANGPFGTTGHWNLRRTDARVEPVLGVILGADVLVLTFQPYFTVAHGNVHDARCVDCVPGVELLDYTQSWGFAAAITVNTR